MPFGRNWRTHRTYGGKVHQVAFTVRTPARSCAAWRDSGFMFQCRTLRTYRVLALCSIPGCGWPDTAASIFQQVALSWTVRLSTLPYGNPSGWTLQEARNVDPALNNGALTLCFTMQARLSWTPGPWPTCHRKSRLSLKHSRRRRGKPCNRQARRNRRNGLKSA